MFRDKSQPGQIPFEVTKQLDQLRERSDVQSHIVQSLIFCLKEFSFDLAEIGARKFKSDLDELSEVIQSSDSPKSIERAFDAKKESILSFISLEETYLREKEQELKDIIDLMRDNLSALLGSNRDFTTNIYESSLKIEQVSQLDDIRRIKERLRSELSYMKKSVQEKQVKDTSMMESLSKEVDSLRVSLEQAKDESMTDALTTAGNRLALDMLLDRRIERNKVSFRRFSVMMCDLDHFKVLNDTYGHQIGDMVLKTFVQECRSLVRDEDFIGRYGGEEFVILLPGVSLNEAIKRANKIRSNVASRMYTTCRSGASKPFRFTVSIGVSEALRDDTAEDVLRRADLAMYLAKSAGRNRVESERNVRSNTPARNAA